MLKLKKMVSALLGVTMVANMVLCIPAFADETIDRTYVYDDYEITYNVTTSWDDIEMISVILTNTGDSTIENWMLSYEGFTGTIDDIWNATVVETDSGDAYIRNAGYNANIEPNASVSFGYNLVNAESFPEMIVMCQERVTKSNEDFSASLNVLEDWGSAFNAEIVLRNNMDKSLEWWELEFGSNFTITEITTSWAAEKFDLGDASYMFKGTYTGIVPPQSIISLGFSGVKNENLDDPMITVNGLTEVVFGGFPDNVDIESARQAELEYVKELNESTKYPVEFGFNNNGTVYSIDGKFSNMAIVDAESALLALNDVKNLLGMSDPASQLVLDYIYTSESADYKSYFFKEVYNSVTVYGRTVTIVARNNGEALSLDSNFIEITNLNTTPEISTAVIESTYNVENVEYSIYTFDEYEEKPIYIYVCLTNDETIMISAENGSVISKWGNKVPSLDENTPAVESIYNVSHSEQTNKDGELIYYKGEFGHVEKLQAEQYILSLSEVEKDRLQINNSNVGFSFAEKNYTYILQTIPDDIYDDYVNSHKVVTNIADWLGNNRDENGNGDRYVDVGVDVYNFDQIYQGIKVYGRVITLTVNDDGTTILMDSNILNIAKLESIDIPFSYLDFNTVYTMIKNEMIGKTITAELESPVIYSWGDYEDAPVLVYVFLDRENDKTYIVSAETGSILEEHHLGKGLDEGANINGYETGRRLQYFPVLEDGSMAVMKPNGFYNNMLEVSYDSNFSKKKVKSESTYFYEPEAISAYLTALSIYDFYANEPLNHHMYNNNKDGESVTFTVYIKCPSRPVAAADAGDGYFRIFTKSLNIRGNGDWLYGLTHEYTHCIFHAFNNGVPDISTVTRGLNEAYADLFGTIAQNWVGYDPNRSKSNLPDVDFNNSSIQYLIDAGLSNIHGYSLSDFIIYPAYLMKQNGLSENELKHLFYASMTMGKYNSQSSNFNSLRVNVIKAAKALGLDDDKLAIVRAALDEVWEKDNRVYDFTLNVEEYLNSNVEIEDVTVTLRKTLTESPLGSKESGSFVYTVEPGNTYYLEVSAPGYVTYRNRVHMYYTEDNSHTVQLVKLNYDSDNNVINGTTLLKAVDCITNLPVGAIVKFRTYDESFNMIYLTDNTGTSISYLADSTTGYTEAISMAPGYYYPYVSEADNYFVKPMMTVASNNATPDESNAYIYYDSNMDGTAQSHFFRVLVNEYQEKETEFNAFDTLTIIAEADKYVGRSGPTQFGRELYLLCYEPDTEISFDIVFCPNEKQLELLEAILEAEGNLYTDPTTGEKVLGRLQNEEVIVEPSPNSYYNIEIAANNIGVTNPTIITAWELYEGLMNNNGVYSLSKITFDGKGSYSTQ